MLRGFGHGMLLTAAEIVAGRLIERDGVFYLPRCKPRGMFCVIAAEPRRDMLAGNFGLRLLFLVSGAGFGASLALVLALLYQRERSLERQLRRAIRRAELTLSYQQVVDLATGRIVGAEALVRWRRNDGESVRPDAFIALAEEKRFVGDITRFVIRRALAELAELLVGDKFKLTLNITTQDLADPKFPAFLEDCLVAAGIDAALPAIRSISTISAPAIRACPTCIGWRWM
jgi:sensor c-di-GMP phosphodiesterase-like protein